MAVALDVAAHGSRRGRAVETAEQGAQAPDLGRRDPGSGQACCHPLQGFADLEQSRHLPLAEAPDIDPAAREAIHHPFLRQALQSVQDGCPTDAQLLRQSIDGDALACLDCPVNDGRAKPHVDLLF